MCDGLHELKTSYEERYLPIYYEADDTEYRNCRQKPAPISINQSVINISVAKIAEAIIRSPR